MNNFLYILSVIILGSCSSKRDEIEFIDSYERVQSQILKLDYLIKYNNDVCNDNYSVNFEQNHIEIYSLKLDKIAKNNCFCNLTTTSYKSFREIIRILKNNNITYAYKDSSTGVIMFGYLNYNSFESLREISVNTEKNINALKGSRSILYIKDKLILSSPIRD